MYKDVKDWLENSGIKEKTVESLSEIIKDPKIDFKVGDRVVYEDIMGNRMTHRIIAISKENPFWKKYGNCIYMDCSCYWFPFMPQSLKLLKDDK